jgi:uncharacterized membrane protein
MERPNSELLQEARESLSGRWGLAIGGFLVGGLITGVAQNVPVVGIIISLIITGPMMLGLAVFAQSYSRKNKEPQIDQVFSGFNNFGVALGTYLLMILYVFLWMLLLIVPGIIAAISYSQVFFILADNPSMGASEVLDKSKQMMNGYKMKYFLLGFNFIGWALLCILTLGIGFLWLMPYVRVTYANFYNEISDGQIEIIQDEDDEILA